MKRFGLTICLLVTLAVGVQRGAAQGAGASTAAQKPQFVPGRVIILAEPGAITLPPGLSQVPVDRATFAKSRLRDVFARRQARDIRQAAPSWFEFANRNPTVKVFARRKGQFMQPDAMTDFSWLYVVELPDSADIAGVVAELNAADGVVWAEPYYII